MNRSLLYDSSLAEELASIKDIIITSIGNSYSAVTDPLKELVRSESKMLRPAFLLLSARFGKYDKDKIYPFAAAVEMIHTATLIHDDIIDNSKLRRGKTTLYARFGAKKSVLMGDYLLTKAFKLVDSKSRTNREKAITDVIIKICESEIANSTDSFDTGISELRYIRKIAAKTASLFALSTHIGATESGSSDNTVQTLRRAGYCTGMGFQIIDDILDCIGKEEKLGKPAGSDLTEGTFTLPVIYALSEEKRKGRTVLAEMLKSHPYKSDTMNTIISMVKEYRGIESAWEKASVYTARAIKELGKLPETGDREILFNLTKNLLIREN